MTSDALDRAGAAADPLLLETDDEAAEPVAIGAAVGVGEGDDAPLGLGDAGVAGGVRAELALRDDAAAPIAGDRGRSIT